MYFSKKKERELAKLYPDTSNKDISRILKLPLWLIEKKAKELALEKDDSWEGLDKLNRITVETIEELYLTTSNEDLAGILGIKKSRVEHEAFRLGLRRDKGFWSNLIETEEEKEQVEVWNAEYDHTIHGSSRGNFVLGKVLQHMFPFHTIASEEPIGGLRIDWYIREMSLGFEVQGVQHYQHIQHFHKTKDDFLRAQERDIEKSYMCEKMGIAIVYIEHDEKITIPLIKAKINEVI